MPYANEYDPLQAFIELFKDVNAVADTRPSLADLPLDDRLRRHIIDGEKEGLVDTIDQALELYPPLDIINNHLLDGMKTVGELFGSGKMQLPFVLQSAEVMKMAVATLEPRMERVEGQTKGKIILATVKGDVHDIGKNLVDIILSNNGYTVINLGIKQPISNIISAWKEHHADAIGLSGLLVKSVNVMEENLRELNELAIDTPVILGGAALSRHYAEGYLRSIYHGSCLYGKDAFEGLRLMDHITAGTLDTVTTEIEQRLGKRTQAEETIARSKADQARRQDAFAESKQEAKQASKQTRTLAAASCATAVAMAPPSTSGARFVANNENGNSINQQIQRSDVARDIPVPTPPFLGSRVVENIPLDEIYPYINPVALFRGQWQFKRGRMSAPEYDSFLRETVHPIFNRLKQQLRDQKILQPRVVYGYFPCQSENQSLIIYDPASVTPAELATRQLKPNELPVIERFTFPRQTSKKRLCISDFFKDIESGKLDVVAFHCVTMGPEISEHTKALFAANDYTEYLYAHGMGVETAEALAELWHKRIRQELGIAGEDSPKIKELFQQSYRGSRYSPGYPACPDMADQDIIWRLIKPDRIGCNLTENWQIDPEQSTSAFIVHHPEARYFNV